MCLTNELAYKSVLIRALFKIYMILNVRYGLEVFMKYLLKYSYLYQLTFILPLLHLRVTSALS